ncbi:YjcZ family sporulation protein [Lysinibacillus agricola]|uniref:YjcZ family sporulation protein n=1 Tax=Lysinibacillus agricola TaxID=2590012 RepID=A0ABX7B015_9BACI|nr:MULTISPECIES: YjcZ family sporulation protein [Lysinibacillus]QQP14660.1 YjcZ family sporulation protein [Lysinibacillus agricola]
MGYCGEIREERRERNPFALVVVLFILLIIVGTSFMNRCY